MVENEKVNSNLTYNWGMAGFSRGQGVPLHRGLHQLGVSTNSSNILNRLITVAYAYIPLQLNKSLSIFSLHLIWTGYSQPGLKRPRIDYTRLYSGLGQFILRSILWPEGV